MHIEDSEAHWLGAPVLIDNLLTNATRRDLNLRAPFHVRDLSKVSAAESSSCRPQAPVGGSARGTAAGQFLVRLSRNCQLTDLNTSP
jgi:hypothetical protein